ncbi:MAG: biotin synthase [Limnohabitans sp.]|nr:biotin synthase [Limnohabitans sp.]
MSISSDLFNPLPIDAVHMDGVACARWLTQFHPSSVDAWLHQEVARRMAERLTWIKTKPTHWAHWLPLTGSIASQKYVQAVYSDAVCHVIESSAVRLHQAKKLLRPSWWQRIFKPSINFSLTSTQPVHMLWSNMTLHHTHRPQLMMKSWCDAVDVGGFVMFSCLGPDTLRQLRAVYEINHWPAPSHSFTDMHDWGDMLLQSGFSEPIMDMQRIQLTYANPHDLWVELRTLGRNLNPYRFRGLRGKKWWRQLQSNLSQSVVAPSNDARITMTFEVIYGHAFKASPKIKVSPESSVSLENMKAMLGKK